MRGFFCVNVDDYVELCGEILAFSTRVGATTNAADILGAQWRLAESRS